MRKLLRYQNLIMFILLTGMILAGLQTVPNWQHEQIDTTPDNYTIHQPGFYWTQLQVTNDPTPSYAHDQANLCWVQLQVTAAVQERWDFFDQSITRDHREWWWLYPKLTQSSYLVS